MGPLLSQLAADGVRLAVERGALVAHAPRGVLTVERRAWLALHRRSLLAELLSPEAFETWDERAAIVAEGCAWDRDRAEREALPQKAPRGSGT